MADKKFSELETASEIKNSDFMALSQDTGGGALVSLKATILAIATKMLTAINFTSALSTTDKTVIGAINEVAQGGGGGGSGHTILDNDGTALAQEDNLQFKGAYSEDNSTDGITEVNVYREMTKAEYDLLSDDDKQGIIYITDEPDVASVVDGVFIDTDNLIFSAEINGDSVITQTYSYTATEDCFAYIIGSSFRAMINSQIEDVNEVGRIAGISSTSPNGEMFLLKKGQTLYLTRLTVYSYIMVYGIQQGSQAVSTYSETVLWSGTELCNDSNAHPLTLADDYTNYDALVIFVADNDNEIGSSTFLVSGLELNTSFLDLWYAPTMAGSFFQLTGSKAINVYRISGQFDITYKKIIGIKY